ncbi:MAG: hypothetical protein ACSW75_01900, partial [Lachnospiraceae bacterium]
AFYSFAIKKLKKLRVRIQEFIKNDSQNFLKKVWILGGLLLIMVKDCRLRGGRSLGFAGVEILSVLNWEENL